MSYFFPLPRFFSVLVSSTGAGARGVSQGTKQVMLDMRADEAVSAGQSRKRKSGDACSKQAERKKVRPALSDPEDEENDDFM